MTRIRVLMRAICKPVRVCVYIYIYIYIYTYVYLWVRVYPPPPTFRDMSKFQVLDGFRV